MILLHIPTLCYSLLTALGVSYLALSDVSYPTVLGFSFLNELMKEFLGKYPALSVNQARRPYSFIDFSKSFINFKFFIKFVLL